MAPNHPGGTTVGNSFAVPSAIDVRVRCTPGAVFKNAPRLLGCVGETATNAVKPSPNDGGSNPTWKPPTALPAPLAPIVPTPPRKRAHPPSITRFRVERIRERTVGFDCGSSEWDAARAAFAHRGRLFDSYYMIDIVVSREAVGKLTSTRHNLISSGHG